MSTGKQMDWYTLPVFFASIYFYFDICYNRRNASKVLGGICVLMLNVLFSVLAVILGLLGIARLLPYNISLLLVLFFISLGLLLDIKDFYKNGLKKQAKALIVFAILVYITVIFYLVFR